MKRLALVRHAASVAPEDRGALLSPDEVRQRLFSGKVSQKWVLANIPASYRHKVGRLVLYYEGEVRQWIETLREVA